MNAPLGHGGRNRMKQSLRATLRDMSHGGVAKGWTMRNDEIDATFFISADRNVRFHAADYARDGRAARFHAAVYARDGRAARFHAEMTRDIVARNVPEASMRRSHCERYSGYRSARMV